MADENKDGADKSAAVQKPAPVKPEQAKKEQPKEAAKQESAPKAPEPVKAPEPKPEVKAAPQEEPAPAPAVVIGMQLNEHDQVLLTSIMNRVDSYCEAMKPRKPINPKTEGAAQQKALFKILDQILGLPGPLFTVAWTNFLAKVKEHRKGVFHEKYAFRFLEHTKVEPKVMMNYRNIIHLAIHTADPQSRQQMLKLINIELVCQNMTPAQHLANAPNKIYGYYHDPL
jgi:hypothetical protein